MMTLWIVIAVMLLMTIIILLWPLAIYKHDQKGVQIVSQKQENINIFQERLAELENERDQDNLDASTFQQLKTELEKTLLGDVQLKEALKRNTNSRVTIQHWFIMGIITAVLVLASLATYNHLGASEQYAQYLALADVPEAEHSTSTAPDFATAVQALKAKLAENPEDMEKWFLLANSYAAMGDFKQAADVYNQIAGLLGEEKTGYAAAKAAYAQMMYQVAGENMLPVAQQAINEALRVDPEEPTALILLGLKAYQEQSYAEAIAAWEKAKAKAGKAQITNFIDPAIQEARRQSGEPVTEQVVQESAEVTSTASIKIYLDISPALRAKVSGEARIFVFAKAGMPMPLAAEHLQVQDLPMTLVLDDSKAAMPTAKMSSAEYVDITARVALSGSPKATKGDFYATAKQVPVHEGKELTLVIDQIVE